MDKAIIFAILGLLILGLLFANPISNLFKGIFGGRAQTGPGQTAPLKEPPSLGPPKQAIEKFQAGPIQEIIEVTAEPPAFFPEDEKTSIKVKNASSGPLSKMIAFITDNQGSIIKYLNRNFALESNAATSFEWDGTDEKGNELDEGGYFAHVAISGTNNDKMVEPIQLYKHKAIRDRKTLFGKYPWPKPIQVGLTPAHPTAVFDSYEGNGLYVVTPKYDAERQVDNFPLPTPSQVFIDGVSQKMIDAKKLVNLSAVVVDQDNDRDEWAGKPFKLKISLNYTNFFKNKDNTLPATETHSIQFETPPYPPSPPIQLTVSLNESGAILYKKGNAELESYLQTDLSFKKGWDLIGVDGAAGLQEEKKQQKVILAGPTNPVLVVTNPSTEGTKPIDQKTVQKAIKNAFLKKPFTHLLIIGKEEDIPMLDWKKTPLDSFFYGDIDNDSVMDLSVGRLPFTAEQLKEYYGKLEEPKNYAFFSGPAADSVAEENNRSQIRKMFLYTGYLPVFDTAPSPPSEFKVTSESSELADKGLIDYFYLGCPDFKQITSTQTISKIINTKYCPVEAGKGTISFFETKTANIIGFTKELGNPDGKEISENEIASQLAETAPFEHYSLLVQKIKSKTTIGESFKDYLNGTVLFTDDKKPFNYILFGDPSNIVNHETMPNFNPAKKVFSAIDTKNNKISLVFPKIGLNEILAQEKRLFIESDAQNIKNARFFFENATITKEEFPFVTALKFLSPDKSNSMYSLDLVDLQATPEKQYLILDQFLEQQPSETRKKSITEVNYLQFEKLVLRVKTTDGKQIAEILEADTKWPASRLATVQELPKELQGKEYYHQTVKLKHDPSKHSNFLNATGKISEFTQNGPIVSFKAKFENLPPTTLNSPPISRKIFSFVSYRLVLENSKGEQKTVATFFPKDDGSKEIALSNLDLKQGDFDSINLYGSYNNKAPITELPDRQGLFDTTPILSGKLNAGEMGNYYGFLQYPKGEVTVDLYYTKSPLTVPNLYYTIKYDVKPFIDGGKDEIILLATDNQELQKYSTEPVLAAIKKIKESDDLKSSTIDSIQNGPLGKKYTLIALNAKKFLTLKHKYGKYTPFFSNSFTLMPSTYPPSVNGKSIKEAFDGTQKIEAIAKSNEKQFPFENIHMLKEGDNRGISYEFGLKEFFKLLTIGAAESEYKIEVGPFEKNLKTTSTVSNNEQEQPLQEPPTTAEFYVKITKIEIGTMEWNTKSTFDLKGHENDPVIIYVSTNAKSFEKIDILSEPGTIGTLNFSLDIKTYEPGQEYPIYSNRHVKDLLSQITDSITIIASMQTKEGREIESGSTIIKVNTGD